MTWGQELESLARELGDSIEESPELPVVAVAELDEDEAGDWPHRHGIDCCCWPDHCFESE